MPNSHSPGQPPVFDMLDAQQALESLCQTAIPLASHPIFGKIPEGSGIFPNYQKHDLIQYYP